jgi:hypothetical protein
MMNRFFRRAVVLVLLAVVSSSCVNRNITYVQVPTASELVTDRTKSGEPVMAKIVVSGTTEIVPAPVDPKLVKQPPASADEPKIIERVPKGFCPVYRPPTLPAPPAAPLDKLSQLKPTDTAQIDALTRNHIQELHQYIATSQATLAKSYKDYITNCEREQRRPAKKTG